MRKTFRIKSLWTLLGSLSNARQGTNDPSDIYRDALWHHTNYLNSLRKICGPCWDRTSDPLIMSQVL